MTLLDQFKRITTFVFDMDGVLTDGTVYVLDGGQYRRMNIKDGFALQLAIKKRYRVVVISGSTSDPAVDRLHKLGLVDIFMGVKDKKARLEEYMRQHGLQAAEVLMMGDDIPDYEVMKTAGLACAPADAVTEIKEAAHYISLHTGGMGCVRDVIEKVLKLNDHWDLYTHTASI
ncbi:KdsC family phosphatase [Paraflavitalea pollutisoli]|uniref:KdsC family phosphatase n=1 Tax=Paraflavitalea pollutisoli TaxID=3034143 RepID=UPI0023EB99B3|nr:HAD hydrolase family protein [Paraflavitalea sp. H1-2-19X]